MSFGVRAGLLVSFFLEFCRSVNTLCLFGMSDSLGERNEGEGR